ncbi:MAG: hypothetical protein JJU11_17280 [Candidatus Sumerlaeia bacterium]|nr:hypothetical protein [Candidatus Sumerlaeia bacterium]
MPKPAGQSIPPLQTIVPVGRVIGVSLDAVVTIMFPADTFLPRSLRGVASGLSENGMNWMTFQLTPSQVQQIQSELHFAKVVLDLPTVRVPIKLRAAVASVTYRLRTTTDPASANLGLQFTADGNVEGLQLLNEGLEKLRSSSINTQSLKAVHRPTPKPSGIMPRKL